MLRSMSTDDAHPSMRMLWLRLPALSVQARRKEFLEVLQNERQNLSHPESFVLFMRILLEELGYDPLYLAPYLGVGVPTLYRYAEGKTVPYVRVRSTILNAYTEYIRDNQ